MGEAFNEFMTKYSHEASERVGHWLDHAVQVLKKDQITDADVESIWQDRQDLGKELGSGASEAATEEMKERLIRIYQARGSSLEEAEEFFETKWKEVVDQAESLREAIPPLVPSAKLASFKVVGWVAAAIATVGLVVGVIFSGANSGRNIMSHKNDMDRKLDAATMSLEVSIRGAQFEWLVENLKVPSTEVPSQLQAQQPNSAGQQAQLPVQTSPARDTVPPPPIQLPIVVASVAQTPVTATITRPNAPTETFQTDLGTVYRTVPEARQEIETRAVSVPRRDIHGNIDVRAEFARITLRF